MTNHIIDSKDWYKYPDLEGEEVVEVVFVSDDDGYQYLIPKELENEFEALIAQIEDVYDAEEYEPDETHKLQAELSSTFDQYRKEGHTPSLYAKVGYEKEL